MKTKTKKPPTKKQVQKRIATAFTKAEKHFKKYGIVLLSASVQCEGHVIDFDVKDA